MGKRLARQILRFVVPVTAAYALEGRPLGAFPYVGLTVSDSAALLLCQAQPLWCQYGPPRMVAAQMLGLQLVQKLTIRLGSDILDTHFAVLVLYPS